ncbi:YopX family protein [Neobacillus sp.]|jgi:uncharacterized phage protein (TIGR01671 family)|uniref:YopX family protein n=1 Tax=Neobacillus sp. TaxID=2675273 RepID=UPI0035B52609
MSREIKFRAWDKRNNKWFHQDLIIMTNTGFYEDYRAFEDGISLFDYEYEIMQFTGFKDKNGKEIYEGDILTDYGGEPPVYVEYSEEHGAYCFVDKFDPSGTVYYTPKDISYEQMVVIGNVYENLDLLDGVN